MSICNDGYVAVELRPFKRQVGGHTCVLEVSRSIICKPYIDKEVEFYENQPDILKNFTPKYLGKTEVTCDIKQEKKYLLARVPKTIVDQYDVTLSSPPSDIQKNFVSGSNKYSKRSTKTDEDDILLRSNLEDWSQRCIERQINRYGYWANNQPQKFIMLENLVRDYRYPCLMDLKMGRQQFGEDSNEEKRKLLTNRCAHSTSSTLGFRICGSQTYQVPSDSYIVHDKYVGRDLNIMGAIKELLIFFHSGIIIRKDVMQAMVRKLEDLKKVLSRQTTLLFHSASLLLLYDGDLTLCSQECCTSTTNQICDIPNADECNINYSGEMPLSDAHSFSNVMPHDVLKIDETSPLQSSARFDVRLIDFAHVSERTDEEELNKVDDTIVFGLDKLSEILQVLINAEDENCVDASKLSGLLQTEIGHFVDGGKQLG